MSWKYKEKKTDKNTKENIWWPNRFFPYMTLGEKEKLSGRFVGD